MDKRLDVQIRYYELTLRNHCWGYWSSDEDRDRGRGRAIGTRVELDHRVCEEQKEGALEGLSKSYLTCLNITSTSHSSCQLPMYGTHIPAPTLS